MDQLSSRNNTTRPPRASHVIPARLLAQFANPNPQSIRSDEYRTWKVWRYDIADDVKEVPISSLVSKDFYSYVEKDGSRNDSNELRMAEVIEGPFNALLKYLESDLYVPNREDGRVISRYAANLFSRTSQRRKASRLHQKETARISERLFADKKKVAQLAAAYSLLVGGPVPLEQVRISMNFLQDQGKKNNDPLFLAHLEHHEESLYALLEGQPYGVLRAPSGSEFIIGDSAVITRIPLPDGTFSIGEGFSKRNVHTLMPVSSRTCLQIGIPNKTFQRLSPEDVNKINLDSLRLMDRWAYSRSMSPLLEQASHREGGSVRYKVNAFVTKVLTEDRMLDLLIDQVVDELFSGRPSWNLFLEERKRGILQAS